MSELSAWDLVQCARNVQRPQSKDYIESLFSEIDYLYGDRCLGDDKALLGGWALFQEQRPVVFLGQQKGRSMKERLERNCGMMHPEGYRKARRLAAMAEKFEVPLIVFIDTPGAFPGIEAEERGQSLVIAENLKFFSSLKTRIICIVIGEGCSGGALGIGVGDRFLMLENTYFSVISPEGCASILFKSPKQAPLAAEKMMIGAQNLLAHQLIDGVIPEPHGGAQHDWPLMFQILKTTLVKELDYLYSMSLENILDQRRDNILYGQHLRLSSLDKTLSVSS